MLLIGEEAQNPRRTIPLAICLCLFIVFIAYSSMAAVLTLIWPYYLQNPDTPIPYAFEELGWPVARWVVSIGTLFGLSTRYESSSLFCSSSLPSSLPPLTVTNSFVNFCPFYLFSLVGALFPLPRIVYAMAEDGLLFKSLARINYRTLTPVVASIASGTFAAVFACLFNLQDLVDLMALATLFAFALVAACIIILRYQPEENMSTASESGEVAGLLAGVAQNQIRYNDTSNTENAAQLFTQRVPSATSGRLVTWLTVLFGKALINDCISPRRDKLGL